MREAIKLYEFPRSPQFRQFATSATELNTFHKKYKCKDRDIAFGGKAAKYVLRFPRIFVEHIYEKKLGARTIPHA